jgi:hypothetical protein
MRQPRPRATSRASIDGRRATPPRPPSADDTPTGGHRSPSRGPSPLPNNFRPRRFSTTQILGLMVSLFVLTLVFVSSAFAAGDANQSACPNEALVGFRPYLPDCRAYEMVSAPFKEGQAGGLLISADGSRVLETSLGVHAGTESDYREAVYAVKRSAEGWETSAVTPSAALYPAQKPQTASAELDKTLWIARTPSQSIYAQDLFVKAGGGPLVKIGPEVPPSGSSGPPAEEKNFFFYDGKYQYAGSSQDLEHILFQVSTNAPLWPGDESALTGTNESLYEYDGVENTRPTLVGVSNSGKLISDCETILGAPGNNDAYNAVSADGATVYFSALGRNSEACQLGIATAPEVTEIYARLNGTETVPISEPTLVQCGLCEVSLEKPASEGGAERPATFSGASADGSKVFFMTEQELFSGAATTNLYEYDFSAASGAKIIRASTGAPSAKVLGVARVSQDGSHVYFVAEGLLTKGVNAEGHEPTEGRPNLYVFERDAAHPTGRVSFIATLSEADGADWRTFDERPVQTTPDGSHVVFDSTAGLTPDASGEATQVYEYDALSGRLIRVSVPEAGYSQGLTNANLLGASIGEQSFQRGAKTRPSTGNAISADGGTVVFTSAAALTPNAEATQEAGATSAYEYRAADAGVFLISGAQPAGNYPSISPSGIDLYFTSADPLTPTASDSQYTNYDARVDGGTAAAPSPTPCSGEGCLGAGASSLALAAPGSESTPAGDQYSATTTPVAPPRSAPKPPPLTRAQKLKRALKACSRKPRKVRARCNAQARHRYGPRKRRG